MRYGELLLSQINNENKNYFILSAENLGGIYYIIDDLKDNYLDVGISEQSMIGIASGLALRGNIPIVHAMSAFLIMRGFEFIRTDVGLHNLPVKLVGSAAGFLSESNGATHQSIEDISLMRSVNNMNIFCPADTEDLMLGLPKILDSPSPYYIRYVENTPINVKHQPFEIGKAEVFGNGNDVAIITYGTMFEECFKVKKELKDKNIQVTLVNLRSIVPFDKKTILEICQNCDLIVTVEDHKLQGGLFSLLAEQLVENNMTANILPIALENNFKPSKLKNVIENEGFSKNKILKKIMLNLNI